MPRVAAAAAALLAVTAILLAGCSGNGATQSGPQGPAGTSGATAPGHAEQPGPDGKYVVHLNGTRFVPDSLAIPVGATVVWVVDNGLHDVTEGSGDSPGAWSSDEQGMMSAGHTYERTFTEAGLVHYRCRMHESAGMAGTLSVG